MKSIYKTTTAVIAALLLAAIALAVPPSYAGGNHDHKKDPQTGTSQKQEQGQGQDQHQRQNANADANSDSSSSANSESLSNSDSSSSASTNSAASNGGNTLVTNEVRQAPALIAGSLIVPQCSNGANGGASAPGGGAFAGVIWSPKECKLLRAAGALQALGLYSDACRIVVRLDSVQSLYKQFNLSTPDCIVALPVTLAPQAAPQQAPIVVNVQPQPAAPVAEKIAIIPAKKPANTKVCKSWK